MKYCKAEFLMRFPAFYEDIYKVHINEYDEEDVREFLSTAMFEVNEDSVCVNYAAGGKDKFNIVTRPTLVLYE